MLPGLNMDPPGVPSPGAAQTVLAARGSTIGSGASSGFEVQEIDVGILILDAAGNTIFEGGLHAFGPNGDPAIFCSLLS